ncbi:hypothetical protein E2I00_008144, partial [Balaenoptera physalus]
IGSPPILSTPPEDFEQFINNLYEEMKYLYAAHWNSREHQNYQRRICFLADGTGIVSFARYGSDIYLSYCECKVKNLKKNLQVTLEFLITIIFLKSWVFCYFNPVSKLQCAIHVNIVERFGEWVS